MLAKGPKQYKKKYGAEMEIRNKYEKSTIWGASPPKSYLKRTFYVTPFRHRISLYFCSCFCQHPKSYYFRIFFVFLFVCQNTRSSLHMIFQCDQRLLLLIGRQTACIAGNERTRPGKCTDSIVRWLQRTFSVEK